MRIKKSYKECVQLRDRRTENERGRQGEGMGEEEEKDFKI